MESNSPKDFFWIRLDLFLTGGGTSPTVTCYLHGYGAGIGCSTIKILNH